MKRILNHSRFQTIARAMSRNYGVEVRFGGTGPETDGRIIYLPANADSLPGHDQESLEGWTDHEACHVEEEIIAAEQGTVSPMTLQGRARKMGASYGLLHNVYEDIRIERKKSATHPGVAENLSMINERSIKAYHNGGVKDVWQNIAGALIATGRGLDTSWIEGGLETIMELLSDEIKDAEQMVEPMDAFDLAIRTANKLKDLADQAEQEQERRDEEGDEDGDGEEGDGEQEQGSQGSEGDEDGDGDDQEQGDEGSEGDDEGEDDGEGGAEGDDGDEDSDGDDGEGEGDGSDEGDDDGEGTEGQSSGGDDDSEGEDGSEGAGGSAGGEGGEPGDEGDEGDESGGRPAGVEDLSDDDLEALAEELEGIEGEPGNDDFIKQIKGEIEKAGAGDAAANRRVIAPTSVAAKDGMVDPPEDDLGVFTKAREDVQDQIGTLKRKLSTVLRARQQTYFQGDKDDGVIDSGALYGLRTGERRVFAQRTVAETNTTAITLLVDLSGSMENEAGRGMTRLDYARRTAIALAETLDSVGVPFEVLGFNNGANPETGNYYCRGLNFERWSKANGGATRHCPFHITPIKTFTDTYRRVRARFGGMEAGGHNGDGDALMFAAKRLASRPEPRKMLIVISDGQPDGPAPRELLSKHLTEVIKTIAAAGIETYGIGAGYNGVTKYYSRENGAQSVVITDLSTLAISVFKLIRSRLLARKPAA